MESDPVDPDRFMVVGLDGSPGAATALAWAAAHVERFGPIQPVAAWQYPWWALAPRAPAAVAAPAASEFHQESSRVANEMVVTLASEVGLAFDEVLPLVTTYSEAGPALVSFGAGASLIVVGTRGRGALARSLLGSVSTYCVNYARRPVAVIPPEAAVDDPQGRVVVGVDGSDHAVDALIWALTNTSVETRVEVVVAWEPGSASLAGPEPGTGPTPAGGEKVAAEVLESAVAAALDRVSAAGGDADQGRDRIDARVEVGDPREVLRTVGAGADLLVVGARGRQHLAFLLLGSVATALVHHAEIPTIVVRD